MSYDDYLDRAMEDHFNSDWVIFKCDKCGDEFEDFEGLGTDSPPHYNRLDNDGEVIAPCGGTGHPVTP